MDRFELTEEMEFLSKAGLIATPRPKELNDITETWYLELQRYDIRLFQIAAREYARENDRFPTLKNIFLYLRKARKEHKAYGNEAVMFDDDVEEMFWGIQLTNDVKDQVDLSKQLRERKAEQLERGLKLLKDATPGLTEGQRRELERRIARTDARPGLIAGTYKAFLYDNAMEILSQGG